MDGKIGPRCGMLMSELAPDVESALDVENGPRLGTNPRSESNIYIYICLYAGFNANMLILLVSVLHYM